ncbi:MAG: type II toxin-antitoxin system RelE/ParE family toxin [Syntrophomonadaceae bacterium]|jgi:toxin ParE1/3/4
MNYAIQLTPEAQNDLRSIFEYIAYNLQSVQNAAGQLNRLEKGIASLHQMPERFRAYDKEPWRSRNLRIMPVDNYLIFYIPDHDKRTVTILRVMYGGRNIDRHLNEI